MLTLFLIEYSQYTMVLSETGNPRVVHSEGCEVYSVHCAVYSVHCAVYSVHCAVYSVQCMEVHVRKPLNGIKMMC